MDTVATATVRVVLAAANIAGNPAGIQLAGQSAQACVCIGVGPKEPFDGRQVRQCAPVWLQIGYIAVAS
jgi:hypothetical protein